MSVKVMGLVWDEQMERGMKFILLAYADHADHEGGNIFPAIETISKKTGYDERSVQRLTTNLEQAGYLVLEGNRVGGVGKSTHWRIPVKGDKLAPIPKGDKINIQRVTKTRKRVTKSTPKGDTMSPDPSLTFNDPPVEPLTPPVVPVLTPQQVMFGVLSDVTGSDKKLNAGVIGKTASKLIEANYSPEFIQLHYSPGGWWYLTDWRGKQGDRPKLTQIIETIGLVLLPSINGNGTHKNGSNGSRHSTPYERSKAALAQVIKEREQNEQ